MIRFKIFLIFLFVFCLGTILTQAQTAQAADNNTPTILVKSVTTDGKPADGMWTEIKIGSKTVLGGYTPLTFNATSGTTYIIDISDYENLVFSNWNTGSTNHSITVAPAQDLTLIAYYSDKAKNTQNPAAQPQTAPAPQPVRPMGMQTTNNTTEPSLLPIWLRDVASMWLGGQLNDKEFIIYLQRLVDDKILIPPPETKPPEKTPPKPEPGFSKLKCTQSDRYVELVGKYTNGERPYEIVSLRMVVLDSAGEILASGSGKISNIGAHDSKYFSVVARHHLEFASCDVQVESVLPKLPSRN